MLPWVALPKTKAVFRNRKSSEQSSGGAAAEIVLPFADLPRGALHLGFEDFVGDPAQEIQGGGHWSAPRRCRPVNHGRNLQAVRTVGRDRRHRNSFSM